MIERMGSAARGVLATLIVAFALAGSSEAAAESTWNRVVDVAAISLDVATLRPLGFVAVTVGSVLFIPAAFLSLPMGKEGLNTAWETFVKIPAEEVFQRPLGEFSR